MATAGKSSLSLFNLLLRISITAIFLLGLLPIPALAAGNGTIAGQVTDNTTSNPVPGAMILVYESGAPSPGWNGNSDAGRRVS